MKQEAVRLSLIESQAIVLTALSIFGFLALFTYVPLDVSIGGSEFSYTNIVGPVGAYFALGATFALGWVAYIIPLTVVGGSFAALVNRAKSYTWLDWVRGVAAYLVLLVSACVLVEVALPIAAPHVTYTGGFIGYSLTSLVDSYINALGLFLVSAALLLASLQTLLRFSWVKLLESVRSWITAFWEWLWIVPSALWRGWIYAYPRIKAWFLELQQKIANLKTTRRYGEPKPAVATKKKQTVSKPPKVATLKSEEAVPDVDKKKAPRRRSKKEDRGILPSFELLDSRGENDSVKPDWEELDALSERLQEVLSDYKVDAKVTTVLPGPVVTRYELELAAGVKVSTVLNLKSDIARALAKSSVRIVPNISGKTVIGIEIPNDKRSVVNFKEVVSSSKFPNAGLLPFVLGQDVAGNAVFADIQKMPHLLVAGTTGSGKSVGLNVLLMSLLFRLTPEDARLILIDPKMLELSIYDGIPHLLAPVVTEMEDATKALQWCVVEMDRRYRLMSSIQVRNLANYNRKIETAEARDEPLYETVDEGTPSTDKVPKPLTKLPSIVVIVDEFAELMLLVGKQVESVIQRLSQKARAAGIHLVLATQRPSVDVITGLIKANIPTRISFQVSSGHDSKTILDQYGAEQLLGYGDMLFKPSGLSVPDRVHGAFVSDEEVLRVIESWKEQVEEVSYERDIFEEVDSVELAEATTTAKPSKSKDALYEEAVKHVVNAQRGSVSYVQRQLRIGYNRAANIVEAMETAGVVSAPDTKGNRQVLLKDIAA